jgi:galactokinase
MSPDDLAARAAAAFRDMTGRDPAGAWAAPGRVNVIGEHTDYNDGLVLPMAIDRHVVVCGATRPDGALRVRSLQRGETREVAAGQLDPAGAARLGWAAYAAGMAWVLRGAGRAAGGADLVIDSSLPDGAGLSSSAALECATGLALAELGGGALEPIELARLAQRAENEFVRVPCGIMDQLAASAGVAGHVLFIDVRALSIRPCRFDLAAAGLALLAVDTRTRHRHGESGYADRRAACERAAALLGLRSLRDLPPDLLDASLARLGDAVLARRVRHVVHENERVERAVALLDAGRPAAIGPLLTASHASLRDDYEVSCAELDLGVDAALAAGALGARMIGGGFGGSLIALAAERDAGSVGQAVRAAFSRSGLAEPAVFRAVAAAGARRVFSHDPDGATPSVPSVS